MIDNTKFVHIGVAVRRIEDAIISYGDLFGYRLLAGPFEDPIQSVRVCFVGSGKDGDIVIELVEPIGNTSPVTKVLARENSAYHVCYEVKDIDLAVKEARAEGCLVVAKPVPAIAFQHRRIAWLYLPSGQLIEILEQ